MAPIESLIMPTYVSDFAGEFTDVKFKLKRGRSDLGQDCGNYAAPINQVCSSSARLFSARALIVTFQDGEKVRFPVSDPANITACATALKAADGVACIDLDGEEWGVIPPTVGNYTSNSDAYELTLGQKSEKINGSYDYTSDVLGTVGDKFAIEQEPIELSGSFMDCIANPRDKDKCVITVGVKARHIKIIANGLDGSSIVRKGKVSLIGNIPTCIQAMSDKVLCVGYKGESIKNLHLLLPS